MSDKIDDLEKTVCKLVEESNVSGTNDYLLSNNQFDKKGGTKQDNDN